jgi:hypothetical protein
MEFPGAEENAEEIISHYTNSEVLSVVPFDDEVSVQEPSLGDFIVDSLSDCDWGALAGCR